MLKSTLFWWKISESDLFESVFKCLCVCFTQLTLVKESRKLSKFCYKSGETFFCEWLQCGRYSSRAGMLIATSSDLLSLCITFHLWVCYFPPPPYWYTVIFFFPSPFPTLWWFNYSQCALTLEQTDTNLVFIAAPNIQTVKEVFDDVESDKIQINIELISSWTCWPGPRSQTWPGIHNI